MYKVERGLDCLSRYAECSDSLKKPVRAIVDQAIANGWTHDEVSTALINLAADLFPEDTLAAPFHHSSLHPH